jgi:(R,R)-butanediol dehydrogenase/meso-butanediol dehydrogenase/diacetyl reductase
MPQILGHEFTAEVIEVGDGVSSVRPGDRCAILPHVFCGKCHYCVRGRQALCRNFRTTGMDWPWGGLATEAIVPAYQAVQLPDEVSYEQGALLEPLASAYHGVQRAGLALGDTVLVTGAGPIGQLAVMLAASAGATDIYVSDPNAVRREMAAALGVSAIYDPTDEDVVEDVVERTEGLGVDISLECSGAESALSACVDATRPGGTIGQIALHVGGRVLTPETWTLKDLTICGTWSFNFYDTPKLLGQIASGVLPVERIVTRHIGLDRIVEDGFEALADPAGDQVKVLVESGAAAT